MSNNKQVKVTDSKGVKVIKLSDHRIFFETNNDESYTIAYKV